MRQLILLSLFMMSALSFKMLESIMSKKVKVREY